MTLALLSSRLYPNMLKEKTIVSTVSLASTLGSYAPTCMLFILLMCSVSACGPSLSATMSVPDVPIVRSELGGVTRPPVGAQVYVDNFVDARSDKSLIVLKDRSVQPEGDVANNVALALEGVFRKIGYEFSEVAPVLISGEVRKWAVDLKGGFTKDASAEAAIYIEVLDPANRRAYSGVYTGFASVQSPSMNKEDLERLLVSSMREAIKQLTADEQFLKVLSSF